MTRITRRSFVVGGGVSLAAPPLLAALATALQPPTVAAAADSPEPYKFSLVGAADSPIPGGTVHRANKAAFPILAGVAAVSLALDPGAIRQPHLHTNANELSYIATGRARVGLIGPGGETHRFEIGAGEMAYQPMGWPHWLENIGDGALFAIFMYSHEQPATIDLPDVVPNLPTQGGY